MEHTELYALPTPYQPSVSRYEAMPLRRCGKSGLKLPALSLGLWHNFGGIDPFENARALLRRAVDLGITCLDVANNYGPPFGSAEETLGRVLKEDLGPWRDELVITTKAGYEMWPGPYGQGGGRKALLASLDASLRRLNLDYVDIFYHHCPDPETPLEETMAALAQAVHSGKALYVGLSNYSAAQLTRAEELLGQMGIHCLIEQSRYNLLDRAPESELLPAAARLGVGFTAFCPLAQGVLTGKYAAGIPADSRAAGLSRFLTPDSLSTRQQEVVRRLSQLARGRGQTMSQMALSWLLRDERVTSVLIGASRPAQLEENAEAARRCDFSPCELAAIEEALAPRE